MFDSSEVSFTIVAVALVLGGAYWFSSVQCHAKYDDTYSPVSWGVLQGCKATFNGRHIPVERIREQE